MRIGEIAAFYNISVKAMRVYEKMGIIKPVKIDGITNYRYYAADQVQQLDALLELKELGFSLMEIKTVGGRDKWLCFYGSPHTCARIIPYKRKRLPNPSPIGKPHKMVLPKASDGT